MQLWRNYWNIKTYFLCEERKCIRNRRTTHTDICQNALGWGGVSLHGIKQEEMRRFETSSHLTNQMGKGWDGRNEELRWGSLFLNMQSLTNPKSFMLLSKWQVKGREKMSKDNGRNGWYKRGDRKMKDGDTKTDGLEVEMTHVVVMFSVKSRK